jgi:hypothetical protein
VSPLWRSELRAGLCPDRLVLAGAVHAVKQDPVAELRALAADRKLAVVLSNHFVRYAVLPWSRALPSELAWTAYAQHTFSSIYGPAATGWDIRVSRAGRSEARVASAVDTALLESLRSIPGIVSIEPYLMVAGNARRRTLGMQPGWFVLHEPGRLTLGLIENRCWKIVRCRQAREDWRDTLADVLDRELAAAGDLECEHAFVCSEQEVPAKLGRYRLTDVTLPRGASADARAYAMALH